MNALHTMLQAGFYQAGPVIGSTCTIGAAQGIQIIISQVDEKITMEFEEYLRGSDFIGVVSTSDLVVPPVENTQFIGPDGNTYLIRGIKSDQSSYLLALQRIST